MDVARAYDSTLYLHSLAVAELTARFASHLNFTTVEQRRLTRAALLHDIGKTRIPIGILNKREPLSPEERNLIASHPDIGQNLLTQDGEDDEVLLSIVRDHHERLDGSGYPRGLRAEEISVFVRVVTLCDVFTAITERRPYAEPLGWDAALDCMFAKQTRLDQDLLTQFATMIPYLEIP
ncbi:MAG TPA: HD domain-containing phosphohydrolase [Acidobacteriaceae bacterium]|nr:HD domain-containing phosphohydrolase [Acidobacteriaceae bacterium]